MSNRILQKKLLFLHHLANLDQSSLAYEVYQEQIRLNLPGLVSECQEYMASLNLQESDLTLLTKLQWKRLVKEKIYTKNRSDLLKKNKSYKKLDYFSLKNEEFETKSYFKNLTLRDARTKFSVVSQMTRSVKMHFMSDKKFSAYLWQCDQCGKCDSIAHIKVCSAYCHLREDKDLDDDQDLVQYFQQVLQLRDEILQDG